MTESADLLGSPPAQLLVVVLNSNVGQFPQRAVILKVRPLF